MPLYEYQCQRCQRRVEKIQSFTAAPLTTCEACGGPLEKLISLSAFQLKGSGWYVTDYAKKSGSAPAASETHGEKPSSDGGDGGGGNSGNDSGKGGSTPESKADKADKAATPAAPASAAPAAASTPQK